MSSIRKLKKGEDHGSSEDDGCGELITISRLSCRILRPRKVVHYSHPKESDGLDAVKELEDFSGAKTRTSKRKLREILANEDVPKGNVEPGDDSKRKRGAVSSGRGGGVRSKGRTQSKPRAACREGPNVRRKRICSAAAMNKIGDEFGDEMLLNPEEELAEIEREFQKTVYSITGEGPIDYEKDPPPGVLGKGKGEHKLLPRYEFKSQYQYLIPRKCAADPAPWKRDPAAVPDLVKLTVQ
jgi:hypothetical protein